MPLLFPTFAKLMKNKGSLTSLGQPMARHITRATTFHFQLCDYRLQSCDENHNGYWQYQGMLQGIQQGVTT
jgi:hypothetical protein